MKKSLEKKIEQKAGKKLRTEIKREVEAEIKKEVKKEVERKLHLRLYDGTKKSASKLKGEFKKQVATGITAAFAFLIALSWRTPIKNSIDGLIERMGLIGKAVYIEYISAVLITIIAVFVLMFFSKWTAE